MNLEITPTQIALPDLQPFEELIALTLQTVAASSARIYGQTFALWRVWCADQGIPLLPLPTDCRSNRLPPLR